MKKPLVFVAAAFACALALRADFKYSNWFSAIGADASSTADLNPTNGSWDLTAGGEVSYASNSGLVFDLEDNESIAFTATDETAPDTNTVTKVSIRGVFTPVLLSELTKISMSDRQAQVAFVIAEDGTGTAFYAWVGGDANAWIKLSNDNVPPDTENVTEVVATFNYTSSSASYASFAVVKNSQSYNLTNSTGNTSLAMTSDAAAKRCIAGFSCYGSGTLVAASGSVGIGVASVDNVKYGSLADAVTAATAGSTIEVLSPTSESVEVHSGVKIADNGKVSGTITADSSVTVTVKPTAEHFATNALAGKSGAYDIPVKVSGGTVAVELPAGMSNKEVASTTHSGTSVAVTIQTATSVLEGATPDGTKALTADLDNLRGYLNTHTNSAYIAADVSSASIAAALAATRENGLKLYQSYALGIEPGTPVKPVPVASDTDPNAITLTIPALTTSKKTDDYTITYQAGSNTATDNAGAIKVPLTTGSHAVKILFN